MLVWRQRDLSHLHRHCWAQGLEQHHVVTEVVVAVKFDRIAQALEAIVGNEEAAIVVADDL